MTVADQSGETTGAPLSTSSSPEELQAVMDAARAAVESQAELEEQGIDILAPADADDEDQVDDEEDGNDGTPESDRDRSTSAAIPLPSAQDVSLTRQAIASCGTEDEYQALKARVIGGQATKAEQERAKTMTEWRQIVGPLYRTLVAEGARLSQAQRPSTSTRTRSSGTSSTKPRGAPTRTSAPTSAKPSPKTPARQSPTPSAARPKLPPMLLATGELNPDFQRLASAGKLYGVDRLTEG